MATRRSSLPFEAIAGPVLEAIYDGLYIIYDGRFKNSPEQRILQRLANRVAKLRDLPWARHPYELDGHVLEGTTRRRQSPLQADQVRAPKRVPRLARLCL